MTLLDGRVAVITGAGQGIGAAILRRLDRDGATVAGLDLRREAVEAVLADCRGRGSRSRATSATATRSRPPSSRSPRSWGRSTSSSTTPG